MNSLRLGSTSSRKSVVSRLESRQFCSSSSYVAFNCEGKARNRRPGVIPHVSRGAQCLSHVQIGRRAHSPGCRAPAAGPTRSTSTGGGSGAGRAAPRRSRAHA
eukprot:6095843-Prymnesium_polylepis.3